MGAEIVTTCVEAVKSFATGIADTAVTVFDKVLVNTEGGLSNLAIWGLVLGAIALGTAIVRKFTAKV
jgi:hypothetical protein